MAYSKTNWQVGDTITAAKMNKIEQGVYDAHNGSGSGGGITTETDPTVPSWAKQSSKPSYNFSEIGSKPTTLSGYGITNAYTKTEVNNLISGSGGSSGGKGNPVCKITVNVTPPNSRLLFHVAYCHRSGNTYSYYEIRTSGQGDYYCPNWTGTYMFSIYEGIPSTTDDYLILFFNSGSGRVSISGDIETVTIGNNIAYIIYGDFSIVQSGW